MDNSASSAGTGGGGDDDAARQSLPMTRKLKHQKGKVFLVREEVDESPEEQQQKVI